MKTILWLSLLCTIVWGQEQQIEITVEGMTCPLCTMTIKKNLKKQPGVIQAKVRLNTQKATVTYDDTRIETSQLLKAIEEVGYKGTLERSNTEATHTTKEKR